MTNQPEWKYVGNIGDASPLEYGGMLVFEDKIGFYPPEMEIIEPNEDRNGDIKDYTVYRILLEPHTFENGILSDNPYHKDYPVWYFKDLEDCAHSSGISIIEMIIMLCSNDTLERALGFRELVGYFGNYKFDQYHLTFTPEEMRIRLERQIQMK